MSNSLYDSAVLLLKQLIATPSFSKEEQQTAEIIAAFFGQHQIEFERVGNNLFAKNKHYDINKPTILLNSHHDTVLPNKGYTLDPFDPIEREGKLFGLGSNDAGVHILRGIGGAESTGVMAASAGYACRAGATAKHNWTSRSVELRDRDHDRAFYG